MKKLLLSLALILGGVATVSAQDAGKMWVGGSASVWSSKPSGGERTTQGKILPEFGYMMSDKLGIGAEIGYIHNEEYDGPSKDIVNAFRIAPFVRMTVIGGELGSLFIDGGLGYSYGKQAGVDDKAHLLDAGFKPGVAVNIAPKLSLIGKFGFLGYQYSEMGDYDVNSFGFDFDMSNMQIGAIYKF